MATHRPSLDQPLYPIAQTWRRDCLEGDGSLFTPGRPVWSSATVDDLCERFVDSPDPGEGSFQSKLRGQLKDAKDATVQLAAEALYVHFLAALDISGSKKLNRVQQILEWTKEPVSVPEQLARALDGGFAKAGVAFKTYRPFQVAQILVLARELKRMDIGSKKRVLSDPWEFKKFQAGHQVHAGATQRNALMHLLFPTSFEPSVSDGHKRQIVEGFEEYQIAGEMDVDRQLAAIRQRLESERGTPVNFYSADLRARWQAEDDEPRVPRQRNPAPVPPPVIGGNDEIAPIRELAELEASLYFPDGALETVVQLLESKGQVILCGPPGTGKTFVARKLAEWVAGDPARVEKVQLHPSYAYEDFVEGFRPKLIDGAPGFVLKDGTLKRIAAAARRDPEHRYVLLIDEINRGNLAKVFGELYYLLEYREDELRLPYSDEPFSLPKNLRVIGTMNTADRSIALVDLALRRRFHFFEFFPDTEPVRDVLRGWLEKKAPSMAWLATVVDRANELLGDRDAAIGPSYFMRPGLDEDQLALIWKHSVMPHLAEQLYGESERLRAFELSALRAGTARDAEG